jgi:hypothetical protein
MTLSSASADSLSCFSSIHKYPLLPWQGLFQKIDARSISMSKSTMDAITFTQDEVTTLLCAYVDTVSIAYESSTDQMLACRHVMSRMSDDNGMVTLTLPRLTALVTCRYSQMPYDQCEKICQRVWDAVDPVWVQTTTAFRLEGMASLQLPAQVYAMYPCVNLFETKDESLSTELDLAEGDAESSC